MVEEGTVPGTALDKVSGMGDKTLDPASVWVRGILAEEPSIGLMQMMNNIVCQASGARC